MVIPNKKMIGIFIPGIFLELALGISFTKMKINRTYSKSKKRKKN